MTTTIRAIPTWYAGILFRSRLEARWAVFFHHMGYRYEYEPQRYEVSWRLSLKPGTFTYLPDFWLPDLGLFVEVKGALTVPEANRLLNAAAHLSDTVHGGDLVVAGSVPNPDATNLGSPITLHMHKGNLNVLPFIGELDTSYYTGPIAQDQGGDDYVRHPCEWDVYYSENPDLIWPAVIEILLHGLYDCLPAEQEDAGNDRYFRRVRRAYRAARSARFEHGQYGAPFDTTGMAWS